MALFKQITLTNAQLATVPAREFVDLCLSLGLDGEFSDADLRRIADFLAQQGSDIPAIVHLRALLNDAFMDGVISEAERALLHRQIERVLPAGERERLASSRKQIETARNDAQRAEWQREFNLPTKAQRADIDELGGTLPEGATRSEAATLIERLLHSNASITPRQKLILRFWAYTPDPTWGKIDISEWLDAWYGADPDRAVAWELFQKVTADAGRSLTLENIPEGAGAVYLAQVKSGTAEVAGAPLQRSSGCLTLFAVIAVIGVVLFIVLRH